MDVSEFVRTYRPRIEREIEREVSPLEDRELVERAVKKGKRLRPLVSILAYKIMDGKDESKGLKVAASTEFAHGASLLKDEVIDRDTQRRGVPALWTERGTVDALRTADSMILQGIRGIMSFGPQMLETFLSGWSTAWKGEAGEFSIGQSLEKIQPPMKQGYYMVIGQKTGSLFATAAKLGAQAAEAPDDVAHTFYNWGYQLGILYQLTDDYVDTKKGKMEIFPFVAVMQIEDQLKSAFLDAMRKGKVTPLEALGKAGIDIEQFFKAEMEQTRIKVDSLFSLLPASRAYTPVAAGFPDWMTGQMMQELQEKKK